jgi:NAD(P)-dependent dehydrogenase (short-subunit alcohol dehydrogenase family)
MEDTMTSPTTPRPPLEGKVALVAGASRGIGAATAGAFARAGAAVVLAARDKDALERVAEGIRAGVTLPIDGGQFAGLKPPRMYRQGQPMEGS